MTQRTSFSVICCRPDPAGGVATGTSPNSSDPTDSDPTDSDPGARDPGANRGVTAGPRAAADDQASRAALLQVMRACAGQPAHFVGRRPGKQIDDLLTGRLLVVGDDADLAAVVLRLLRTQRLGAVEVAYASPRRRTPVSDLWDLPRGVPAVDLARSGEVDLVPLVRDDVGGVLVGAGYLGPVNGTAYVDELRVLRGPALRIKVEPDREKGLAVTVIHRRPLGIGRRPKTVPGRAVQIGTVPTTVVRDGIPYARPMDRWTFYRHTEPLRLVRGMV